MAAHTEKADTEHTTIQILVGTRKLLTSLKHGDATYDTIIVELASYYTKHSGKTIIG
jgi:hypothetical protein